MAITEAQYRATRKYAEKTYKRVTIALRKIEDADVIRDIEESQEHGMTTREYMQALYNGNKTGNDIDAYFLKLSKEEDADIIASIERAESLGVTPRKWLRQRFK